MHSQLAAPLSALVHCKVFHDAMPLMLILLDQPMDGTL